MTNTTQTTLRERVADAIGDVEGSPEVDRPHDLAAADAAIAICMEEAAAMAENEGVIPSTNMSSDFYKHNQRIAQSIRNLAKGE